MEVSEWIRRARVDIGALGETWSNLVAPESRRSVSWRVMVVECGRKDRCSLVVEGSQEVRRVWLMIGI